MHTLLRHWRKAVACALLFASLILFAMEMRSRVVSDVLALSAGPREQWLIVSKNDTISIFHWEVAESEGRADGWQSFPEAAFVFINTEIEQQRARLSFTELHIPFWCLILPMTLFAGALLFTKRRSAGDLNLSLRKAPISAADLLRRIDPGDRAPRSLS